MCKFDVDITGFKEMCEVVLDLYNDNRLVGLKNLTANNDTVISEEVSYSYKPDCAKVMLWNSLSGLMPLCEAEVIPSSEFIVE